MKWYLEALKKYAVFSGRARRKEYWMFLLFHIIITVAIVFIADFFTLPRIITIYALGLIIPTIAVQVRRLHDTGRSGWWSLMNFIPLIGPIVLIILLVQQGSNEENKFGKNPKLEGTEWPS